MTPKSHLPRNRLECSMDEVIRYPMLLTFVKRQLVHVSDVIFKYLPFCPLDMIEHISIYGIMCTLRPLFVSLGLFARRVVHGYSLFLIKATKVPQNLTRR